MTVYYPFESVPISWHIMIMAVATVLTILGLSAAWKWKGISGPWMGVLKDIIPVGGIILALAAPLIASVFVPVLDYSVIAENNKSKIDIKISNLGFKSAKNVQVYLMSDRLNFIKLDSTPLIFNGSSSITSDKLAPGNGIFHISSLASKSQTFIHATTHANYAESDKLVVYVRSDESSAFHNLPLISLAYLVFASTLVFDSVFIISRKWDKKIENIVVLASVNIVATVVIFLVLFFGTCGAVPDCHVDPAS